MLESFIAGLETSDPQALISRRELVADLERAISAG